MWKTGHYLGKASKKKPLSFGHCPKGGGSLTGIQKFWGSFVFPSLTFFWTLIEGSGGMTRFQMFWGTFLPKYWVNIWILGLYKSYLTVVQNGSVQKLPHGCPKWGGGDNVQKKDAFFWMVSLTEHYTVCSVHSGLHKEHPHNTYYILYTG